MKWEDMKRDGEYNELRWVKKINGTTRNETRGRIKRNEIR